MSGKRILVLVGIALLAGCGREEDLRPAPGHAMPVKPQMARATPTYEQLMTPPTQARPTRIDELVTRSKPRPDDPFDLPPPTGGAAHSGPAGTDPGTAPANATDNSMTVPPGE